MENKTKEQKTLELLGDELERKKFEALRFQMQHIINSKPYNFYEGTMNGLIITIDKIEKLLNKNE